MDFRGEDYYEAAIERMEQALAVFNHRTGYAVSMYCGGLAVECLLRAFRWRRDKTFEGRHDLQDLLKASELLSINEDNMRRKGIAEDEIQEYAEGLRAAMSEIKGLWHNNLRFASEARLRAFLNQSGRLRGIKGDPLRKNARDLLNAAQVIVQRGVALWIYERKLKGR